MSRPITWFTGQWADLPFSDEPTAETKQLLALMATGATDRAVAREMGISERTVHRRIAHVQAVLGAHSRFQLGVLASIKQWL